MPKPNNTTNAIEPILQNLSELSTRMSSLQTFISHSLNSHTLLSHRQMSSLSNEILAATRNAITNAAAILSASSETPTLHLPDQEHAIIVELDAVDLLAKHFHYCQVCGKGFTRHANLRMHMRAHGDQFKTREALAREARGDTRSEATRFSCPFEGCNRNKVHKRFRPLKSVLCLRNHFKRSHCPKTLSCELCRKKSFAVLSDLKSHMKQCRGEPTWKCTCGTTFSRKDKLFGHVALFEGHLPALQEEERENHGVDELPEGFFDGLDDFVFGSSLQNQSTPSTLPTLCL